MCNLTIYWKIFYRKSENVYLKFDRDSAILSCDNDDLKSRYKSFLQFIVFYLLQWIRTGKKRKRLRKKSHILVARYLADQMPATKSLQSHRKAFCLGSILPDIKPSFLTKKHEYFGTFEEIQGKMKALIDNDPKESKERVYWRRFGEVMHYMADTKTPQGVLAVAKQKKCTLEDILKKTKTQKLLMILENIQDPGNLGTIIRAGEGAGITGVVMSSDTADIYNPKVIRSTMGSVLRVPFVYASDLKEACEQMKKAEISLYAAHLKGMHNYDQEDYTKDTGFLIGNEAKGLTDEMAAVADTYIKIPMAGQVESLNAAVASSVLMFEAARQRRNS